MRARHLTGAIVILFLILNVGNAAAAVSKHNFQCTQCHRPNVSILGLGDVVGKPNVCLECHNALPAVNLNAGDPRGPAAITVGAFVTNAASDAMTAADPKGTSHRWAAKDVNPAAGARAPAMTYYYSRYGVSKGKITCTRCHQPHAVLDNVTDPDILRPTVKEESCRECHVDWWVSGATAAALSTHPVGIDYSAYGADARFKAAIEPTVGGEAPQSDVQLIAGKVLCSSCHRTHYADSDATTADGIGLSAVGDGYMLRSDGPGTATAQKRSNLCQACHTYKMHGNTAQEPVGIGDSLDEELGCLDCHGGHGYAASSANYFILRQSVTTAEYGTKTTLYTTNPTSYESYCVSCHGPVSGFAAQGYRAHTSGEGCAGCHAHDAAAYSFAMGSSAEICGDCHGAPPRTDDAAIRSNVQVDTGYAVGTDTTYAADASYKPESTTPHQRHAGAINADKAPVDYAFGSSALGIPSACTPCHNDINDTVTQTHDNGTSAGSFRNVFDATSAFDSLILIPTLTPTYAVGGGSAWKCSNVYCHSNGGRRRDTGVKQAADYKATQTPSWSGTSSNTDPYTGAIVNSGSTECQQCHGDTVATMAIGASATQKSNSQAHNRHLTKLGDSKTTCYLCHSDSVDAAGAVPAAARNIRSGGKHVNGAVEVKFSATAFNNNLSTGTYTGGADGTCAVYCHNPLSTDAVSGTPDWDNYTGLDLACDACHEGLNISTKAHPRHIAATGANIGCDNAWCHGSGATTGTHSGHFNGTIDFGSCDVCHGVEVGEGGSPVWTNVEASQNLHCATCHSGNSRTSYDDASLVTRTANDISLAQTAGHNRPTVSSNYPVTGRPAANQTCQACHDSAYTSAHLNATKGDKRLVAGFDCGNCHNGSAAIAVKTHSNQQPGYTKKAYNTGFTKACLACHNPHGTSNIAMISTTETDFAGTVVFSSFGNETPVANDNSFDESETVSAGANNDDICATCHSNPLHNNRGVSGTHKEGENCLTCHGHNGNNGGFMPGAGTRCNECHGNPPNTGAHGDGVTTGHTRVSSNYTDEDRTDCAFCHTGAEQYTYDPSADQLAGGDRGNHGVSRANRQTVLAKASVGYFQDGVNTNLWGCSNACHSSSAADSFWFDTTSGTGPATWLKDSNGISCNACHFYKATVSSADVPNNLSDVHDEHFAKGKGCTECHGTMTGDYAPGTGHAGPLAHINSADYAGAADDGAWILDRAQATQDEAGYDEGAGVRDVQRSGMTYTDANTCSGGIGLGCHATGTPDWDIVIPNTNAGCLECHTDTDTAAVNPTSGIHDNNPNPITSGIAHDGSFLYNNGTLTADCVSCHTTAPSSGHFDGTLQASYPTVAVAAAVGFVDGTPPTCTASGFTGCHLEGTSWTRLWDLRAYNNDATRCAVCHGTYGTGWIGGVSHKDVGLETRGSVHNNAGSSAYPCADCHVLGASTNNYTFSEANDWAGTSHHGDNLLQISNTQTGFTDAGVRVGCATASCHSNDGNHDFKKSTIYTTANAKIQLMAGDVADVPCSGCHGGGYVGTNGNNYWPDSSSGRAENTAGAHEKHMVELAKSIYNETKAQLLTNNTAGNPGLTADAKQKEICSYCHTSPGADGDHGVTLPAEVNSMYRGWLPKTVDNGVWTVGNFTCATVDCHFNKTTPTTNDWYDTAGNGTCVMCHVDVTVETAHTKHTSAATGTTFGRASLCADCHEAATNWGTNTAPATGHIDGTYAVAGSRMASYVGFTYPAVKGTCGTNDCHNNGLGGAPAADPTWGTTQTDCTICHAGTPATGTHVKHMNSTAYVPSGCNSCHTAGSNSAHLNLTVDYAGALSVVNANDSCTNTCHLADVVGKNWVTGVLACTDCHAGTGASAYIGGNKTSVGGPNYMPQYTMHLVTPTVSGVVHDATVPGAGGNCAFCHDSLPASGGSHIDGTWVVDSGANTDRGMYAGFTDGSPATCTTACHSAGVAWTYKWSASAGLNDGSQCDNCHGTFATGFNTGVMHAGLSGKGNTVHTGTGNLSYPCLDCHAIGSTNNAYPFANTSNDWYANLAETRTTKHGDGSITMNVGGTSWARNATLSGCSNGCHADGYDGSHYFNQSAFPTATVVGDTPNVSAGCNTCHGGPENWPNGSTYPDRAGQHSVHVSAIAVKLGGDNTTNRNASCNYCHPNPGAGGHYPGGYTITDAPADVAPFKNIISGGFTDADGVRNWNAIANVTCSTVDCHFNNAVTPHWYYDAQGKDPVPPAQVALSAVSGDPAVKPRSIKVSWTSPGDDANVANTTVHRYDMRYGTSSGIASDFARTDNYVGGLPLAYAQGTLQEVVVDNLTPGQTYYFSLRCQDVSGNWSTPSAVVNAVASGDTVKPYFGGINRALKADESATVNVEWSHAEDHTMPVTYKLWVKKIADGALDMNTDAATVTGIKGYKFQVTGLINDTPYQFGVRACDGVTPTANCDSNTEVAYATPTDIPLVTKTYHKYLANGAAASGFVNLDMDGVFSGTAQTGAVSSTATVTFIGPSLAYPTTFYSDSFSIYITNGAGANTYTATLGKSTGAGNFTSLGVASPSIPMAKNAKGFKTFKLVDASGKGLAANERIAVRISATANGTLAWGTTTNGGTLNVAERLVNAAPLSPNLQAVPSGALIDMSWQNNGDGNDGISDTVHYDLYGSDGSSTYLIATGLPAATTSYAWNTQLSGIALTGGAATVSVTIKAGDGYSHTPSTVAGLAINNNVDNVAPNAITDLVVRRRAKAGSVILRWTAPGDDFENNGRAKYYDVRYSTSPINEGNFASADRVYDPPTPGFGGEIQEMEIATLTPLAPYYFAIKTYDEGNKVSPISTARFAGSDQEIGGPKCGMCHTTAPSVVESVGNHRIHGITVKDCVKCHGSQVESFGLDHQDGQLLMGWSSNGPQEAIISGNRVYYTDNGLVGGNVLYDDNNNGAGGFYNGNYDGIGTVKVDDGTCMNFVGGCHGPAGSAGYGAPNWISTAKLNCADCHGKPDRTNDSFYNRAFDGTTANGGTVPEQIKGSPPIDNHGYDGSGATEAERKYVGIHEKHLNYSFRFAKGDSCDLCHPGRYSDKNDLDGKHGDGYIDVKLDPIAAGEGAYFHYGGYPGVVDPNTAGTCGNMSPERCHPSASSPKWDSAVSFDCVNCHGFNGATPSHVTDPAGGVSSNNNGWASDPMPGNCTYCHFGGHPRDDVGGTAIIVPRNSQVGINWSTGIHIRKTIPASPSRSTAATEAELCWSCHDANGISEWGADNSLNDGAANNSVTAPPNGTNYDYGDLYTTLGGTTKTSNWTTGYWSSGQGRLSSNPFWYKRGIIQSTHSTDETGTAQVTGSFRAYTEQKDTVDKIRCSNCHDVHNLNLAPSDATNGQPYLRGSWIRNPYLEDGAPWNKAYAVTNAAFGAVPRAGSTNPAAGNELGGYQIDQNNGYPTAGMSLAASAGICTLCHGTNVDGMDKTNDESFWLGTNGHSNSSLGGTASAAANIFGHNIGGRPAPNAQSADEAQNAGDVFDMALQSMFFYGKTATDYGTAYRSQQYSQGFIPQIYRTYAFNAYQWGATVDASTTDVGYHAFTCSKCHNPHASRLPKLMITNCLDTRHSTWDTGANGANGQTLSYWTSPADVGELTSNWNTAQNCHRYDSSDNVGGWNKVTPW